MQVYLEVIDGPLSGRRMVIRPPAVVTVGRTENADLAIPGDQRMSSVHLRLECDHNSCSVLDLDSTNGVLVNGQPVKQQVLNNGDRIIAGETTIRIHIENTESEVNPPVENKSSMLHTETKVAFPAAGVASGPQRKKDGLPDDDNRSQNGTADDAIQSESGVASMEPDHDGSISEPFSTAGVKTDRDPASSPGRASSRDSMQPVVGAILEVKTGKFAGQRIWVPENQSIRIGRAKTADKAIDDDRKLSSTHFAIECCRTGWQIRDLNSSNGTFVNGQRVAQHALVGGERILAGATTFIVHLGESGDTTAGSQFKSFEAAMADDDPSVRSEALQAAVWTRQPWLLKQCREKAALPTVDDFEELRMLAIIGNESDVESMQAIARATDLGPQRFELLASYGHPEIVDDILDALDDPDPLVAVAAGQAFTRITGMEIESSEATGPASDDENKSGEPTNQSPGNAVLPDSQRVKSDWAAERTTYVQGTRWCCGHNLTTGVTEETFAALDMLARREVRLRGKYNGTWQGDLAELERLPS